MPMPLSEIERVFFSLSTAILTSGSPTSPCISPAKDAILSLEIASTELEINSRKKIS